MQCKNIVYSSVPIYLEAVAKHEIRIQGTKSCRSLHLYRTLYFDPYNNNVILQMRIWNAKTVWFAQSAQASDWWYPVKNSGGILSYFTVLHCLYVA